MIPYQNYLCQYRGEIQNGNIIAGRELIIELDKLIKDRKRQMKRH